MVDEIKENEEKDPNTSQSNDQLNKDNSGDISEESISEDMDLNSSKANDQDMEEDKDNSDEIEGDNEEKEGLNSLELLKTIAKLEETIIRLEAEKESANNSLQRMQADFTNYRKRTDKEMGKVQSNTIVELIRELLPVIDNFERALAQDESDSDFRKGIEMIYRQFLTFLEKQGAEVIDAVGEDFDHNYHHAVMQVESEDAESGVVIEELQKGYILGDIVIRPAMVKVVE